MIDTRQPVWVCLITGNTGQDLSYCRALSEDHIFCGWFMLRRYVNEGQVREPVGEGEKNNGI